MKWTFHERDPVDFFVNLDNRIKEITSHTLPADKVMIIGESKFASISWIPASDGFFNIEAVVSFFLDGLNCLLDCYNVSLLWQINPTQNENGRALDLRFVSSGLHPRYRHCSISSGEISRSSPSLTYNAWCGSCNKFLQCFWKRKL